MFSVMRRLSVLVAVLSFAPALLSQQPVSTNGGSTNAVAKFSNSSTIVESAITESNGNVGIGTPNPLSRFTLMQTFTGDSPLWGDNSNGNEQLFLAKRMISPSGNLRPSGKLDTSVNWIVVPEGTSASISNIAALENIAEHYGPGDAQGIFASINWAWNGGNVTGTGVLGSASWAESDSGNVTILKAADLWTAAHGGHVTDQFGAVVLLDNDGATVDNRYGIYIAPSTGTATRDFGLFQAGAEQANYFAGNIGLGTQSPSAKLEINGNLKLASGSGGSIVFADGTVQSTAWAGTTCGGDYAESVDVSGEKAQYEPGDVMVIDLAVPGHFVKSSERYSTAVAGIYSTKPGLVGRRQLTSKEEAKDEVPMALVGIVPTKVSAENEPIKPGDPLVSSSKPGYAMKGTDRKKLTGAIIGKAMGSLASGTGFIEVLVSLQ